MTSCSFYRCPPNVALLAAYAILLTRHFSLVRCVKEANVKKREHLYSREAPTLASVCSEFAELALTVLMHVSKDWWNQTPAMHVALWLHTEQHNCRIQSLYGDFDIQTSQWMNPHDFSDFRIKTTRLTFVVLRGKFQLLNGFPFICGHQLVKAFREILH